MWSPRVQQKMGDMLRIFWRGATGGIVDFLARFRIKNAGHQDRDFAWRVELTRALSLTFGKLADEAVEGTPQDVRLNILPAQPWRERSWTSARNWSSLRMRRPAAASLTGRSHGTQEMFARTMNA